MGDVPVIPGGPANNSTNNSNNSNCRNCWNSGNELFELFDLSTGNYLPFVKVVVRGAKQHIKFEGNLWKLVFGPPSEASGSRLDAGRRSLALGGCSLHVS